MLGNCLMTTPWLNSLISGLWFLRSLIMSNKPVVNESNSTLKTKIAIALALILLGLGYWLIDIQWRDIQINKGFDEAARKNPYLAAQMFLRQSKPDTSLVDKVVQSQSGLTLLDQLPTPDDNIIMTGGRYSMSERRTNNLIKWMKQGGHLIVVGKKLYKEGVQSSGDLLLDHFNISVLPADLSNDEDEESQEDEPTAKTEEEPDTIAQTIAETLQQLSDDKAMTCEQNPLLSTIPMWENHPDIDVHIKSPNVLNHPSYDDLAFWASDGYGPQIMQLKVGLGDLTVLTDMSLWRNRELACFDNAYLLQILTSHGQKTWLLYHQSMPGVMEMLWDKNHTLVISAIVMLLFWLWSQTLQFGPLKTTTGTVRRNFMEHIEASARYRWLSGQNEQMISDLRLQILQNVAVRHNDFAKRPVPQQIELISRLTSHNSFDIQHRLFDPIPAKTEQIITLVQRLQQLRKQLC
jgi:hypothetical protein